METWMRLGGRKISTNVIIARMGSYICIYLSMPYSYILCGFDANSLFRHIHARMDDGARGILRSTYAVYIPAAARPYYPPSPYYLPAIVYRPITSTAPMAATIKM
jgi:hypothetical protein